MRIPFAIALLVPLVGACTSEEKILPPPPPPVAWNALAQKPKPDAGDVVSEKEKALAATYADRLAAPGFAGLGDLLHEDVRLASPGMDDAHGRTSVVRAHEQLFGAFDQRKVSLSRVLRSATEQIVEWTLTATQSRDWQGILATHRTVTFKGVTLLETKDDGSIVDLHVYFDVALVRGQLGVGSKELVALAPPGLPTASPLIVDATGSAEEKANVALVHAALDDGLEKNEAAYVDAMADDLEVYTQERPQPARGKAEASAYYRTMHRAIGNLQTILDKAWGIGSFVVVEYFFDGEQLAPIGWVPVQHGKEFRPHIVDVTEIRNGKIARVWRYDNPLEITGGLNNP